MLKIPGGTLTGPMEEGGDGGGVDEGNDGDDGLGPVSPSGGICAGGLPFGRGCGARGRASGPSVTPSPNKPQTQDLDANAALPADMFPQIPSSPCNFGASVFEPKSTGQAGGLLEEFSLPAALGVGHRDGRENLTKHDVVDQLLCGLSDEDAVHGEAAETSD